MNKETQPQKGLITCPRIHSIVAEPKLEPVSFSIQQVAESVEFELSFKR